MEPGNTIEQEADETWGKISGEIRRTRQSRRRRKMAVITGTLLVAVAVLIMRPPSRPPILWTYKVPAPEVKERETWAMLVLEDGNMRLEPMTAGEMGAEQLSFSLEPVVIRSSLVENDAAGFAYGFQ